MPIDASGEITGVDDLAGPFRGGVELAQRLAGSRTVHGCLATQWWRYALGRKEDASERCVLDALTAAFTASGTELQGLLLSIVRSDGFRLVRSEPGLPTR
jgi:hypothetical protein